ncbi:MAG TPA: hypothetical protein VFB25_10815 [Gaiellaceae bacterium]|nr:hypothetical protein [Gaiellaceae bacterium]
MANTAPYTIIAGVAKVFIAPVGTDFPAIDDDESAFSTAWVYLGQTDGGIKAAHSQTVNALRTDQVTAPVKAVRSEEDLEISFSLAELTLENYAIALNQAIDGPETGSGYKAVRLYRGGFQVETVAMLARGDHLSPYGDYNLQYEVPSLYQSGTPEVEFTKENKALLATSWMAVAADPNAEDEDTVFGVLRAGTA